MATWSPESIRSLLQASLPAVERATVAIYQRQTAAEQCQWQTIESNGIGYNAADAAPMTKYAKLILAGKQMSAENANDCRDRILKYSGQLLSIAIEKQIQRLCAA